MNARQKRQEKGLGLLDMCLALHGANTGSSYPLPKDKYDFYIENLSETYEKWIDYGKSKPFDDAVKNLIGETLIEDSYSEIHSERFFLT